MTANDTVAHKAARRKLNLLELANDLGNVSEACRRIGYSREQFYDIHRNYQTFGSQGLLDRARGPKTPTQTGRWRNRKRRFLNTALNIRFTGLSKSASSLP